MISIIRNKRTGHVYAPASRAAKEREAKEREEELAESLRADNRQRGAGNEFYITGRRMPTPHDD